MMTMPLCYKDLDDCTALATRVFPMDIHSYVRHATRPLRTLRDLIGEEVARRRQLGRLRASGRAVAAARGEADHLAALEAECARSREADQADGAAVDPWMLPLVALRGLATRAVLRHRIGRGHRALRGHYEALGRAALTGTVRSGDAAVAAVPAQSPVMRVPAGTEAARFGRAFWAQLRPAILPKAPALAGLAAGWWIANTYTDSRWKSLARSIGIGSGGTHVVSAESYRAISFWLPLLAAALCAYLGDRIATAWRESGER
jgi:hypothetical protein